MPPFALLYGLAALFLLGGLVLLFRSCLFAQARAIGLLLLVAGIVLGLGTLSYQGIQTTRTRETQPANVADTSVDIAHLDDTLAQTPGTPIPVMPSASPAPASSRTLSTVDTFVARFNEMAAQGGISYQVPPLPEGEPSFQVSFMTKTSLTGQTNGAGTIQRLYYTSTVQTTTEAVDAGMILALVAWGADPTLTPLEFQTVVQNMLNPDQSIRHQANFSHGQAHYDLSFSGTTVKLTITPAP